MDSQANKIVESSFDPYKRKTDKYCLERGRFSRRKGGERSKSCVPSIAFSVFLFHNSYLMPGLSKECQRNLKKVKLKKHCSGSIVVY